MSEPRCNTSIEGRSSRPLRFVLFAICLCVALTLDHLVPHSGAFLAALFAALYLADGLKVSWTS